MRPTPTPTPADTTNVSWPVDHEAVRFVVRSAPDRRGLQTISALFWQDGRQSVRQHFAASLDTLLASARRRSVPFDVVDVRADVLAEAA